LGRRPREQALIEGQVPLVMTMADLSNEAATPSGMAPRALQLVTLNMEERKVEVDERSLALIEARLRACGAQRVAVVSIMGAFRTGKSFFLDLCLRYLQHEEATEDDMPPEKRHCGPSRGRGEVFPLPAWITSAGPSLQGSLGADADVGFRFRGGMEKCTEGIWVWSEPFVREVQGQLVALLLMDTQGAWDSSMTKEQSATIFGLTALLSSKQIYNVNMQIQEDTIENLAYFMRFAQAALRKAANACSSSCLSSQQETDLKTEAERPFQSLDFLVRDWPHFEDNWSVDQCRAQMDLHLDRHLNPQQVTESDAVEALRRMFAKIKCFCLPHPGLKIQSTAWEGSVTDIDGDFVRFCDRYIHEVFTADVKVKTILGSELTIVTFPLLLRTFVQAFQEAAPAAMSFTQAMTTATVLLAKERALKSYTDQMDASVSRHTQGMEPSVFETNHYKIMDLVERDFRSVVILGSMSTRDEVWRSIEDSVDQVYKTFEAGNSRRLERVLVIYGNLCVIGGTLFAADRISDWTCDWWSQTCCDLSRILFTSYLCIFTYIGYHIYRVWSQRGRLAIANASAELWKEVLRLLNVYADVAAALHIGDLPRLMRKLISCILGIRKLGRGAFPRNTNG